MTERCPASSVFGKLHPLSLGRAFPLSACLSFLYPLPLPSKILSTLSLITLPLTQKWKFTLPAVTCENPTVTTGNQSGISGREIPAIFDLPESRSQCDRYWWRFLHLGGWHIYTILFWLLQYEFHSVLGSSLRN